MIRQVLVNICVIHISSTLSCIRFFVVINFEKYLNIRFCQYPKIQPSFLGFCPPKKLLKTLDFQHICVVRA